jgi:hypothetical protein
VYEENKEKYIFHKITLLIYNYIRTRQLWLYLNKLNNKNICKHGFNLQNLLHFKTLHLKFTVVILYKMIF